MNGDCLEIMADLPAASVDFCLTDPPYGTTACKWDSVIPFRPMWDELNRIVKPNGAICLFGSEPFSSSLRMSNIEMFRYDWVWDKGIGGGHLLAKKRPLIRAESISVFYCKQPYYNPIKTAPTNKNFFNSRGVRKTFSGVGGNGVNINKINPEKMPTNIIAVNKLSGDCNSSKRKHPTQKPVPLLEYLIKTYTLEGETVLDFTMGSGSTGVACKNLNRKFIGIEKDEKYFQIACERLGYKP